MTVDAKSSMVRTLRCWCPTLAVVAGVATRSKLCKEILMVEACALSLVFTVGCQPLRWVPAAGVPSRSCGMLNWASCR